MTASTDILGRLGLPYPGDREPEIEIVPKRRDRRHNHGEAYGRDLIIARIHQWATLFGAPPTKTDWDAPKLRILAERAGAHAQQTLERVRRFEALDWPSERTVREYFGSHNDALQLAGYPAVPTGRPAKSTRTATLPKAGEEALRGYYRDVARAREAGNALALKAALYTLAMSAIREADRLDEGATS